MSKIKKRSVFYSFIYSYIILLVIAMAGWGIVMYLLNRHINAQSNQINEYVTTNLQNECDQYFYRLKDAVHTIWKKTAFDYNSILGKSEFSGADYYNAKEYRSFINEKVSFEGYYINTGVLYYQNGNVMSELGLTNAREYFNAQYGSNETYYDIWINELKSGSGYFAYNVNHESRMLTYCLDCSRNGIDESDVIIYAEMDLSVIIECIRQINEKTGANIIIFDNNKNIISNLSDKESLGIYEKVMQQDKNIRVVDSLDKEWHYAIRLNGWEYSKKSYLLVVLQLIITLLGLLAAAIYSWHASKKHYKPIKTLSDKLRPYKDDIILGENEIKILENGIDNLSKTNKMLDEQSRKSLDIIKQHVLTKLLLGEYESKDVLLFDKYYANLNGDYFFVAIVEPKLSAANMEEFKESDIEIIFINILNELINNVYNGTVSIAEDLFYCIINTDNPDTISDIKDIFDQARALVQQYFGMDLCAAISTGVDGIEAISKAAKGAESILNLMKMGRAKGNIVFYNEFFSLKQDFDDSRNTRERIKNYLGSGDYDSAKALVDDEIVNSIIAGESFESIRMRLILELTHVLEDLMPDDDLGIKRECFPMGNMMQSNNIEQLRANIDEYFKNIVRLISNKDGKEDITDKICQYINTNYADPNLSVSSIGDALGYHSVYISRKFKEKRNETILSYITGIRLQNAKRMLLELDDTIEHIAQSSGYVSVNTFNRVFKKSEGITPSAYREQNHK